jgi:hypothetical protein
MRIETGKSAAQSTNISPHAIMLRLVCDIHTTSFLGTHDVALEALKILRALPASFAPTKVRTSHSPAQNFSFDSPDAFFEHLPGDRPYDGDVSLVKSAAFLNSLYCGKKGTTIGF